MEKLHFRKSGKVDKRTLGLATVSASGTTNATGAAFILQKRIVAATRTGKLSILFDKDFDGYAGKCQCDKTNGEKSDEHTQIYYISVSH